MKNDGGINFRKFLRYGADFHGFRHELKKSLISDVITDYRLFSQES